VLNALGMCLQRLDRPSEALQRFDAVLAIDRNAAFAHANRGAALLAQGLLSQAEAAFQDALALDANLLAATAGLATIATRRGVHGVAKAMAQKVLQKAPGFPEAVMSMAAAELAAGSYAAAEDLLASLLSSRGLSHLERANATTLMGDVLDRQNHTTEAFRAYSAANELRRGVFADRFASGPSALEYVESMNRYFKAARPDEWAPSKAAGGAPSGAHQHVFLIGFPCSGATLLEVVLEGQPQVQTLEEQECLIDGVRSFMKDPADLERLRLADEGELAPLRDAYWKCARDQGATIAGRVFVDKYPLNTLKLPLIARLFPQAKILIARRDPRDVVLSCFRQRFQMSHPMFEMLTVKGAAVFYDAVMRLANRLETLLDLQTLIVRHESLVENLESEARSVCAFLGLTWAPAMADLSGRARSRTVATPGSAQLVRGLRTDGLGEWRRYREQLQPVLGVLAPWVERFAYSR
jgi:hypothetical protein